MGQMQYMRGSQPGSPALGTLGTGDLVRVLDAALNAGFTSQSITSIARVGTTATATKVAHGFLDQQLVLIAGATPVAYNGVFRITLIDADHFSYQVAGSPTTPPTGSITGAVAPLGGATPWGIAFTATNQRAYRAPSGNRYYLMVNDSANTNTATVRAFTAMTGVITGTGPFPTVTQSSTNLRWPRPDPTTLANVSAPDDSWIVVGDEKRFYLGICLQSTGYRHWFYFGDFQSYKSGDVYNSLFGGAANTDGSDNISLSGINFSNSQAGSQGAGAFYSFFWAAARAYDQTTLSKICATLMPFGANSPPRSQIYTGSTDGESSPITAGIELGFCEIVESKTAASTYWRRGRLPNLCSWSNPDFVNNDGKVYSGIPNFPPILLVRGFYYTPTDGIMFPINDWDTVIT